MVDYKMMFGLLMFVVVLNMTLAYVFISQSEMESFPDYPKSNNFISATLAMPGYAWNVLSYIFRAAYTVFDDIPAIITIPMAIITLIISVMVISLIVQWIGGFIP